MSVVLHESINGSFNASDGRVVYRIQLKKGKSKDKVVHINTGFTLGTDVIVYVI